ncbi:hypothetical protein DKM44_03770 [Deinococcus irradiatisoli]|uniref:DUF7452 domain-containing protein n=1 Tax=Deinococcus irradiatisoli TaxID=2202254 RepID=A0A2Z3JBD8_9DEIO|nr:hypothetical protein [Deinococcus irradiatisoli]AWN22463.1 hypothetical protein DKM44_03770 [Deinococcus irradiatisoli]
MNKTAVCLLLSFGLSVAAAAPFTTPNSFTAGTQIKSAMMNENFQAIQTELRRLSFSAFIHTAAGGSYVSCIDNPLTNGDPNAIVNFSHRWTSVYYSSPFGIYYNGSKWCIFSEVTSQTIAAGTKFNVVVYK